MRTNLIVIIGLLLAASFTSCKKDIIDPPGENPTEVAVKFGDDASVAENAGATQINLQFSKPAIQAGTIEVEVITSTPDAFQTAPATVNGIIILSVAKGAASASFTITPVNNNLVDAGRVINFEIAEVSDGFTIGTKKSTILTILDDEAAVSASFSAETGILHENTAEGLDIKVLFSAPATVEGKVFIKLNGTFPNNLFTTQPALDAGGMAELEVAVGATVVRLLLYPNDDALLKGHHNLVFSIADTEGGIIKGPGLSFELSLLDDELASKPLSYESLGGGWRSEKTYSYDELGRIKEVKWETETPGFRSGTDTYYYAANGLVERVNHYPNHDEYYYQQNGRIVRSESIENEVMKEYSEYDYDPAGNVGGRAQYYRQSNGSYTLSFLFIYLYDFNGNLYSQLTYIPGADPENPQLISTRTYDNYSNTPNPFLGLEILPNVQAQPYLPGTYRVEENGVTQEYTFTYEFREDGLPGKRTARRGSDIEVTTYKYY